MQNKIFPATNDVVFKKIFGDINNKGIIKDFLSSILNIPEEEYDLLKIENPFLNVEDSTNEKLGILDVKLSTKNHKIIDIEIQVARMKYMRERVLFYLSKMTLDQIGTGENYGKIQKVVSIIIASDHILVKENEKQHNRYLFYNQERDSIFSDKMEIDVLDLMKKTDLSKDNPNLAKWVNFFNAKTEKQLEEVHNMQNSAIKQATEIVMKVNQDDELRVKAEQRENAIRAYKSEIEGGKQEGIKEGMEKGIEQGKQSEKIEIAKNMLLDKEPIEKIKRYTGLTLGEIEELR